MKYIFTKGLMGFLFVICLASNSALLAENLLITEISVLNADSTFRYLYLYNSDGNKVLETKYFKQNDNWIRKSQKEWLYDANKCVTQRERVWINNDWTISYFIDFDYTNGLLMNEVHNSLQNGTMTSYRKINYEYIQTSIALKSEFFWRNGTWELSEVNNYSYLANAKLLTLTTSDYLAGALQSSHLSTFTYNSDGNVSNQLLQTKEAIGVWINNLFVNWYYTSAGSSLVSSMRSKKWDSDLQKWENTQRTDYAYNNSNQVVTETNQQWKDMFWGTEARYDYRYDENGRLSNKLLSMPIYNEWRATISINYSDFTSDKANFMDSQYNFWGGTTGELTASYIPYMFNNEMVIQKAKQISISYLPSIDTGIPTNFNQKSLNLISVYPNPSEGIYYVDIYRYDLKSWTISDLKGQVLKYHLQAPKSGTIDISDLPKGIYILRAMTPTAQFTQRLIKL
jgi:hypothetical protein